MPGLFKPVEHEGQLLVDGAVCNNLPISVVRQMGAEYVIAVDARPRAESRPSNPLSAFLASVSAMARNAADQPNLADVYICPLVEKTGRLGMPRPEPLLEAGRQAVAAALPVIQAALGLGESPLGVPA